MTDLPASWLEAYLTAVRAAFGPRIWMIGLQGSYGRGEAVPDSDLDLVLILDRVGPEDVAAYGRALDALPFREKVCGFFSGRAELEAWDKADLFQFCNDTLPLQGSLDALTRSVSRRDVRRAVHTGTCNLYHACIHNALHEKSPQALAGLYKAAAYLLQAVAYLEKGVFIRRQRDLRSELSTADRQILDRHLALREGICAESPQTLSAALTVWAAGWIVRLAEDERPEKR